MTVTALEIDPETLADINAVLPGAAPMQAFYIGLACALAWTDQRQPSRALLTGARNCETEQDLNDLYATLTEHGQAHRPRQVQ